MFYFSGTGNSKYIADYFCKKMRARSYSIEEKINVKEIVKKNKKIGFCYPVYSSRVPKIMRDFIASNLDCFKNKQVVIFCTQAFFSGDGARALTDLFPKDHIDVIYAEHFKMPNNMCNLFLFPVASDEKIERRKKNAEKKMDAVIQNIKSKKIKRRGFNVFSRILGFPQGKIFKLLERVGKNGIKISENCSGCRKCIFSCPVGAFLYRRGEVITKGECILCYRCINECPDKAITVLFGSKVKKQYKGIKK